MLDFLPKKIQKPLTSLNMNYLYEIRLRLDKPISLQYNGKYIFLSEYGLSEHISKAIYCSDDDINECIYAAGRYSVYTVEEQIKKGFITSEKGERIGLGGEYVFEKGQPLSIRKYTSLCIRVPHEVLDCGQTFYNKCMSDRVKNVLLMSSPGLGKTTMLRDIARLLSKNTRKNILICDERGELAIGDFGNTCDVLKYCDKKTAFEIGIRSMKPDIIITDELSEEDCIAVKKAITAGVFVLASAHISRIENVKDTFKELFDRYVLLKENALGVIANIYDEKGNEIL